MHLACRPLCSPSQNLDAWAIVHNHDGLHLWQQCGKLLIQSCQAGPVGHNDRYYF